MCSKECIRHFLGAASRRRGRRISKFVSVIDAGGIGRHHFDRRNVAFFKARERGRDRGREREAEAERGRERGGGG